jgi:bifunctional non-homologous end joining protein LigD
MLKPPLQPMLLTNLEEPFDSEDYLFEFKWDGFRALAYINNNNLFLQSRNKKNLSPYFSELRKISGYISTNNVILDGEICFINPEGISNFSVLQKRLLKKDNKNYIEKYPCVYIVWDILSLNTEDIYKIPLIKRKKLLENVISNKGPLLQISPYILEKGKDLYEKAKSEKLEGIVAKKLNSVYEFKRSKEWLKVKIWQYTTVIILGYTNDSLSLIVGKEEAQNTLIYMGKVKINLESSEKEAILKFFPSITIKNSFFSNKIRDKNVKWVEPLIKCRVKYTEITRKNSFRHGYAIELIL